MEKNVVVADGDSCLQMPDGLSNEKEFGFLPCSCGA